MRMLIALGAGLLASCGSSTLEDNSGNSNVAPESRSAPERRATRPSAVATKPPEPGALGGLADDRTPVSEAPFSETSAQGAVDVVQTYFALLSEGKYEDAHQLWAWEGEASGRSAQQFADSHADYAHYAARVGAPGRIEAAAGSLFVEVPVQVFGRTKDGAHFSSLGNVRLWRANNVPGGLPAQRRWRITGLEIQAAAE